MMIGVMDLELDIHHAQSLKEKRAVLNRIKDRVRKKFNVSIAEIEGHNVWNYANLGIAIVSNDQGYCNQVLQKVLEHIDLIGNCEIADYTMEYTQI